MNDTSILKTTSDLRRFVAKRRKTGQTLSLVPTMGALHKGHMALVDKALESADICITSIFVNPTQFAPDDDLDAYPRTWAADLAKLTARGVQAVFYPAVEDMYPEGFSTTVSVSGLTDMLEGEKRPGHFDGVATIVSKLLVQTLPDIAVFGEKDYQQLQVIKRLVTDLNIPVEILGVPTVREKDGLALSSRNRYLTDKERQIAPQLNQTLADIARKLRAGETSYETLEDNAADHLRQNGFGHIDYIAIRNARTLKRPVKENEPLRVLAACHLGKARLIDNRSV